MPLLPPGVCWICDQSPIQDEYRVIDTHRNARPGGAATHESVRKYICEPCAREMGGAMGMVSHEDHLEVIDEVEELEAELRRVRDQRDAALNSQTRVLDFDSVREALSETIREELAKTVPHAPTPDE